MPNLEKHPRPPVVTDQGSKGSPVDIHDTPGRTTGHQVVKDVEHDVAEFVAALEAAVARHVPHSFLRRLVELHEWERREAI